MSVVLQQHLAKRKAQDGFALGNSNLSLASGDNQTVLGSIMFSYNYLVSLRLPPFLPILPFKEQSCIF
jgi:hypothetical protein